MEAATVFNNSQGDGDLDDPNNWSSSILPTRNTGEDGVIGDTMANTSYITTYGSNGDVLSEAEVTLYASSSMTGGTTRLTDSIIRLEDNSTWATTNNLILGRDSGSSFTQVFISGTATLDVQSKSLTLGEDQRAVVTQTGGSVSVADDILIGADNGGANSAYNLSGGTITSNRDIILNRSSDFTITGGSVNIARNLKIEGGSTTDFSGTLLEVTGNIELKGDSLMTQSSGSVIVGGDLQLNDRNDASEYRLEGGRLEVSNRIEVGSSAVFFWGSNGTLAVATGETKIDYRGDLEASLDAILALGDSSQYLDVSGTLDINDLTINGYNLMLSSLQEGVGGSNVTGSYLLIESGTLTAGSFDNTTFNFTSDIGIETTEAGKGSLNENTQTFWWYKQDGNDIRVFYNVAPIPEPSTALIAMIGVSMMALRRRRPTQAN